MEIILCVIFLINFVDTVAETVDNAQKSAQSALDTSKSYVASAKGTWFRLF